LTFDVGRIDLDRCILDLRGDIDAGEGSVPPLGGVEGRDPDESVDTALRLEVAEGVVSLDLEGDRLDACLITFLNVDNRSIVAASLDPALVHAHEHVGPVARLGATCSGIDREVGVGLVKLAREELLELEFLDLGGKGPEFLGNLVGGLELGSGVAFLKGHLFEDLQIADALLQLGKGAELRLDGGDTLHVLLCRFPAIPESGLGHPGLDARQFLGKCGRVKETS
jgi:hypothetical protein